MTATQDAGYDCTHRAIDASEPRYQSPTLAFASANKRRAVALLCCLAQKTWSTLPQ